MSAVGTRAAGLRWTGMLRLGLVQAALGSVVVLITSTLNRVMVVEYSLPAMLPGFLVALHYAVQMIRPRFGHGSDRGGRRTPWILGGMSVLAGGAVLCAMATSLIASTPAAGLTLAVVGYVLVGLGVGAAGTSLLALMATRVEAQRRAAAATIMWLLMVAGFAITATAAGHFLDPFSPRRLVLVIACAAAAAFMVSVAAVWGIESGTVDLGGGSLSGRSRNSGSADVGTSGAAHPWTGAATSFRASLAQIWSEPQARRFTLFVFLSMLAYSAQELILEPFAGLIFDFSLGESSKLSGLQHGGVFLGMLSVGVACSRRLGSLRAWTIGGCAASALALVGLAAADLLGTAGPLRLGVLLLGVSNGVFAVAAIGSMMELSSNGHPGHAGARLGLWGAAQAVAFALGGLFGTSIVDLVRHAFGSPMLAFAIVFAAEAALFLAAAGLAADRSIINRGPRHASAITA
jgi:BCD family chlorophyll transporter-like MFS transporter